MKKNLFLWALLLTGWQVVAQTLTITGMVFQQPGPAPAADVSVFAFDSLSGFWAQGVTDAAGGFVLEAPINGAPALVWVTAASPCGIQPPVPVPVQGNPATGNYEATAVLTLDTCATVCHIVGNYEVVTGTTVQFYSYAAGVDSAAANVTVTWDFGDGTSGTGFNPTHTYAGNGTYTATVTLVSGDCIAVSHLVVPIGPSIQVTGQVTSGDGTPVPFQFVSILDSLNGFWGYGLTDEDGYYVIDISGAITSGFVTVNTYDQCGNYYTQETVLTLNTAGTLYSGVADFTINNCTTSFCDVWPTYTLGNDNEVTFTAYYWGADSIGNNVTYSWDFGDGTTGSGLSVSHTYAQNGDYTVVVTATDGSCTATNTIIVQVFEVTPVQISGTVTSANGAGAAFWPVFVTGGNISLTLTTDQNGNYSETVQLPEGTFYVTISTYDFCTPNGFNEIEAIIVNGAASVDFVLCDSFPGPEPCSAYISYFPVDAQTFQFEANVYTSGSLPITYLWEFGDGATSTEASPVHTYSTPGAYTVFLTANSGDSCITHACEVVFAFGDSIYCPIDTFYYGCQAMFWAGLFPDSNAVMNPLTMTFEGISFGVVQSWHWDFGDGTTSNVGPSVTHTYANTGLYPVTLSIETVDGCESSITMLIYAGAYPWSEQDCQALFMPLPDSTGTGFFFMDMSYSPNAIQSWTWDFGDGTTSTEQFPYHTYTQPGIYTVALTIEGDSCASVIAFDIDTNNPFNRFAGNGTLGLAAGALDSSEPESLGTLKAWPNPVKDQLQLAFDSEQNQTATLTLRNTLGQEVYQQAIRIQQGYNQVAVPFAGMSSGMYLVELRSGSVVKVLKAMKE